MKTGTTTITVSVSDAIGRLVDVPGGTVDQSFDVEASRRHWGQIGDCNGRVTSEDTDDGITYTAAVPKHADDIEELLEVRIDGTAETVLAITTVTVPDGWRPTLTTS